MIKPGTHTYTQIIMSILYIFYTQLQLAPMSCLCAVALKKRRRDFMLRCTFARNTTLKEDDWLYASFLVYEK